MLLSNPATVHPHGRGDWQLVPAHPVRKFGSPPRAWGLEEKVCSILFVDRFTPTGVGTGGAF